MVFSSVIFLFWFLPLTLIFYFAAPRPLRNLILLAFSLLFYAWGEGGYILLLIGSVLLNYLACFPIQQHRGTAKGRLILGLAVGGNLTLLAFFKYANFIAESLGFGFSLLPLDAAQLPAVHLPIGISFFTFQAISYLIDVARDECDAQRSPLDLALYISLFPQLIAGPIVRYSHVAEEINSRRLTLDGFIQGMNRFVLGLAKKALIANQMAIVADGLFECPAGSLGTAAAWLAIACYTAQIYFDFSGYSDMAIGLGRMFGFHFRENFDYPYVSRSIKEFWRRWHISLSSWFRDYLYIPLGGNRLGPLRTYVNLYAVFLLCGLWHGASWNFVIWGLVHGTFLVIERRGLGSVLSRAPAVLAFLYTIFVVMVAWVFFRAETLGDATAFLQSMFSYSESTADVTPLSFYLTRQFLLCAGFAVILSFPVFPWCKRIALEWLDGTHGWRRPVCEMLALVGTHFVILTLLLMCAMAIAGGTHNPFIYYRF